MSIESEILQFKMQLLRKMPFYGDILMRIPIVENKNIPTAQTNGRRIEYNPDFLITLNQGERNFVIMHEIFHIMLRHCERQNEKNKQLWNTAADIIVNNSLKNLFPYMRSCNIPFQEPQSAITAAISLDETLENVYARLLACNPTINDNSKTVSVFKTFGNKSEDCAIPEDIVEDTFENGESVADGDLKDSEIRKIISDAGKKARSENGSYYIPREALKLTQSKKIDWKRLLKAYLNDEISDETSYTTPERKYIHMDLILPGHGMDRGEIDEIWAFVDSSGSITANEMSQFLTQLWRISREFKCTINIAYWDTRVTDVYKRITKKEDILNMLPRHSGGTNINCVYRWIRENKIKPQIMLILTDGYFGTVDDSTFIPSLSKKTILVLSNENVQDNDFKRIGTIATLKKEQ